MTKHTRYKSSITGKFVSKQYASDNPNTTFATVIDSDDVIKEIEEYCKGKIVDEPYHDAQLARNSIAKQILAIINNGGL